MRHYSELITIDPAVRFGRPCIRGMRISVYDILRWLASGMTPDDIQADYPELTKEDILAAFGDRRLEIRDRLTRRMVIAMPLCLPAFGGRLNKL